MRAPDRARRAVVATPARTPTKKRLSDAQRGQLRRFSDLLVKRMRAENISVSKLARYTDLRAETIRSYMRGLNRPTKVSLRRLCMIFGSALAEPFAGTELAGPDEDSISVVHLPNGWAILAARTMLPEAQLARVLELLREHAREGAGPFVGS